MDPRLSPLLISVGVTGAKFLAKKWVGVAAASTSLLDGDVAGELAGGVMDCFKDKIKDVREQRKAARLFEEIGDKIADRLRPTFEQAVKSGQVNVQEVTGELVKTLEARVSAEFFVQADPDPARLTTALRDARPRLLSGHQRKGLFHLRNVRMRFQPVGEQILVGLDITKIARAAAPVPVTPVLASMTMPSDSTRPSLTSGASASSAAAG